MMRSISLPFAAVALLAGAHSAQAQEFNSQGGFTSITTYIISVPTVDTRRFTNAPSWVGLTWEGAWPYRQTMTYGLLFGVSDFFDETNGTVNFDWGAATGHQFRDLTVGSAMATGRWYPRGGGRGPYLGMGAGLLYAQQSYQLGVLPQLTRSAFHLAVAPEAGVSIPIWDGVDALVAARYTLPTWNGNYLGGKSVSFQYLTFGFGLAEH